MITADQLYQAYANGIFPMAESRAATELSWYDPKMRGILPLDKFHMPARLLKTVQSSKFTVTINRNFTDVMRACAAPRPDHPDTWINDSIINLYSELHARGGAHSIEVWQDDKMVGGLYGVAIGAAFCGESMFSTVRDASKVALVHLMARLKTRGYQLCDTQFTTPHLAQFGGYEIPRREYHARLDMALKTNCQFVRDAGATGTDGTVAGNAALVSAFLGSLQSMTATS